MLFNHLLFSEPFSGLTGTNKFVVRGKESVANCTLFIYIGFRDKLQLLILLNNQKKSTRVRRNDDS
ncbi:MAG: hypothetical protein JWQ09_172 [Segetibacter sp.]|nr:hypothetical protein [Segetibacter sp.]